MNQLISDKGVCRTAPATSGLLVIPRRKKGGREAGKSLDSFLQAENRNKNSTRIKQGSCIKTSGKKKHILQ